MDEYFAAKVKLFTHLHGPAGLNYDDKWGGRQLAEYCAGSVISYGVDHPADVRAEKIELEKSGVSYILNSEVGGKYPSNYGLRVISMFITRWAPRPFVWGGRVSL